MVWFLFPKSFRCSPLWPQTSGYWVCCSQQTNVPIRFESARDRTQVRTSKQWAILKSSSSWKTKNCIEEILCLSWHPELRSSSKQIWPTKRRQHAPVTILWKTWLFWPLKTHLSPGMGEKELGYQRQKGVSVTQSWRIKPIPFLTGSCGQIQMVHYSQCCSVKFSVLGLVHTVFSPCCSSSVILILWNTHFEWDFSNTVFSENKLLYILLFAFSCHF